MRKQTAQEILTILVGFYLCAGLGPVYCALALIEKTRRAAIEETSGQ